MSDEEDDIVLSQLSDEDLVQQMHDDLYDGLTEEIEEGTHILLDRGWGAEDVLGKALVDGMTIVGIDFRDGILFVPEVLLAANAMKGGMTILRPLLAETGAKPVGTMVIGTVKGDIHDIGKNLVAMMLEGAGFEVHDIGINNAVEDYLAALHPVVDPLRIVEDIVLVEPDRIDEELGRFEALSRDRWTALPVDDRPVILPDARFVGADAVQQKLQPRQGDVVMTPVDDHDGDADMAQG